MAVNVWLPRKSRLPRWRSRGLARHCRRDENQALTLAGEVVDPNTTSYPQAHNVYSDPTGNWKTANANAISVVRTRLSFPFGVDAQDLTTWDNRADKWDYVHNAHNVPAIIKPDSGGNGATTPRLAGHDLACRIWSAKSWSIVGSWGDASVAETFTPPTDDIYLDAESGRRFYPGQYVATGGETDTLRVELYLAHRTAFPVYESGSDMFAGTDATHGPQITTWFEIRVVWTKDNESGVTDGQLRIQPVKPFGDGWTLTHFPTIKFCGYELYGWLAGPDGGAEETWDGGSLEIKAASFWGAEEW